MVLQRLSHEVGWGYKDVVDRLEEKRKVKALAFHERKVRLILHSHSPHYLSDSRTDRCSQAAPKGHC